MIKIGIELNNVIRNINKQILKYYQKDIKPELELEDINEKDDPFKYCTFNNPTEKNEFIYIDYPYEIFGCAKTMEKDLPMLLNNWLAELTNYEDDDVEISFYSLDEESLTIQSTFFFLSKIGTRVREIIFPKDIKDIEYKFDVIITGNKKVVDLFTKDMDLPLEDTYLIVITNNTNKDCYANKRYGSLSEVIKDEKLLENLQEFVNNKYKVDEADGESN